MKTIIFANSEIKTYDYIQKYMEDTDCIICCDGGLRHAKHLALRPDVLIGDFDSVPETLLKEYKDIKAVTYPAKKDFTDLELCMDYAIEHKATEILIFGAIGSRIDHTFGNFHVLLKALKNKVTAKIIDECNIVQLIDKAISIRAKKGDLLSLIPFSEIVEGVTTQGLAYPLKEDILPIGSTRGISNIFEGDEAAVTLGKGLLFVILSKE